MSSSSNRIAWLYPFGLWVALLVTGMQPLVALGQSTECKEEVRQMLKKLHDPEAGTQARVKVKLAIVSAPRDSQETGVSRQSVTFVSGDGKFRYESAEMSIYADGDLTVNVIHGEKVLYLSAGLAARNDVGGANVAMADARLLEGAAVAQCKRIDRGSYAGKKVLEITKGSGNMDQYGIRSIRYVYDPVQNKVNEVRVNYLPGNPLQYVRIGYETYDLDYRGVVFEGSARSKFLVGDKGGLTPAYQGYQIIKTNKNL